MGSTSWHLGRGPKSTRGCRVGRGRGRELLTPSLPQGGEHPQASSSMLGRSSFPVSLFFFLPSPLLILPEHPAPHPP